MQPTGISTSSASEYIVPHLHVLTARRLSWHWILSSRVATVLRQLDKLGQVGHPTENPGTLYVPGSCPVFQTWGLPIKTQRQVLCWSISTEHVQDCQFPPQSKRDTGGKGRLTCSFCGAFLVWGGYHAASSIERIASQEINLEHKQPAMICPSHWRGPVAQLCMVQALRYPQTQYGWLAPQVVVK